MADFNVDKLKTQQVSTPVTTTPTDIGTVSTSATTKPLDYKTADKKAEDKKNHELYEYVNSDEFKQLPLDEQVKILKDKFFPASSIEDVKKNLGLIKQQAVADNSAANESSESAASSSEQTSSDVAAKTSESTPETKSDLEVAAEKYIEELSPKNVNDIDELKAYLLKKTEKTPEEESLLKALQDAETTETGVPTAELTGASDKELAKIQRYTKLLSSEFQQKTPEEKIKFVAHEYLAATDKNYKNLPDRIKSKKVEEFVSSQLNELKLRTKDGQDALVMETIVTLEVLKEKSGNKALNKYNAMSKEQKKEFISSYVMQKFVDLADTLVPASVKETKEWEIKSSLEKVDVYVDKLLSKIDPEYSKMPAGEQKQKYLENKVNSFIGQHLVKGWDKTSPGTKNYILTDLFSMRKILEKGNLTLAEYKNLEPEKQIELQKKYLNLSSSYIAEKELYIQIAKKYPEAKPEDYPSLALKELNAKETLTEEQQELKAIYEDMNKIDPKMRPKDLYVPIKNLASNQGLTEEQFLNRRLDQLETLRKDSDEYKAIIKELINGSHYDPKYQQLVIMELKKIDPDIDFKQYLDEYEMSFHQVRDIRGNHIEHLNARKDNAARMKCGNTMRKIIPYEYESIKDSKSRQQLTNCNLQYKEYIDSTTAALADRNIMSKEEGTRYLSVACCASTTPPANASMASKSYVEHVYQNNPNEVLYVARELSSVNNPAVTEGLAAASQSVKDPGIRNKYDSYVDNAVLNYPPETQARIRQARETGEISNYTLSQTTAQGETSSRGKSESISETNSRTKTSDTPASTSQVSAGQVKSPAQTPTPGVASPVATSGTAQSTGIVNPTIIPAAAKTSATITPQIVSGADNAGTTSTVNQPKSQPLSDKELEVLSQKVEELLEKIENFMSSQAESIEQHQISNNTEETTAENVTAQMSEDDIIEAITTSDIDTAQLEKLNLSEDEKESLRKAVAIIFENNSVSAAYTKFVRKFGEGAKLKFLEVFATRGDAASIRSFANNHKADSKIISILYQYSQDSSLIAYLPKDEIFSLLLKGKISDLSKINPDILADFIQERMKSETNPKNLLGYLKLLPLEYQGAVLNQYPDLAEEVQGSDKWLAKNSIQNSKTKPTERPVAQVIKPQQQKAKTAFVLDENLIGLNEDYPSFDDGIAMGSTIVPNPRGKNERYDKRKIKGHIYMKG